jgi:DUF4097 and DUF4098 domain-containing protein YvlB
MLSLITMGIFVFMRVRSRPPRIPAIPAVRVETGEAGAIEGERETTTPRSFPLSATAKFSLQNTSGNITIEGWDKPEAEVVTVKRGGSAQDRRNLKLVTLTDGGNLTLQTPTARGIEVEYVVRLPKKLAEISLETTNAQIEVAGVSGKITIRNTNGGVSLSKIKGSVSVKTTNGAAELSDIGGDVSVSSTNGELDLTDIDGTIDASTINGGISVAFGSVVPNKALKLESARGDIEVTLPSTPDADLKVETVNGSIDIDGDFGLDSRSIGPRGGSVRMGKGGMPLSIKTVTGTITIAK